MSANKVTPIRTPGQRPPKPPGGSGTPPQKPEISFGGNGQGPNAGQIWQGLHAICRELDVIDTGSVERYIGLAAAAAVLAELLENRIV